MLSIKKKFSLRYKIYYFKIIQLLIYHFSLIDRVFKLFIQNNVFISCLKIRLKIKIKTIIF